MGTRWDFSAGSLSAGATFTRASSATYFDGAGVLQTASSNMPRFDHDPSSAWAARGLLYEPARTTIAPASEAMSSGAWILNHVGVTDDATTAPDGNVTADLVVSDWAFDNFQISYTISSSDAATGDRVLFQAFLKKHDYSTVGVSFANGNGASDGTQGSGFGADLDTGAIGTATYWNGPNADADWERSLVDVGGGWWLLSVVTPAIQGFSGGPIVNIAPAPFGSGSGFTAGTYFWGLNVKNVGASPAGSAIADSYVRNASTSAPAARAADQLTGAIPTGATQAVVTFDDATSQTITGLTGGASWTVPTSLDRPWVRYIDFDDTGGAASHAANAALTGQGAALSGAAARGAVHSASGGLTGTGATLSGPAVRTLAHAASGAPTGLGSALSAAADRIEAGPPTHAASGALAGQGSAFASSTTRLRAFAATGALEGQAASLVGATGVLRIHVAMGALAGTGVRVLGAGSGTFHWAPVAPALDVWAPAVATSDAWTPMGISAPDLTTEDGDTVPPASPGPWAPLP